MGVWGVKTFENDSALDWVSELEDEKDLVQVIIKFYDLFEVINRKDDNFIDSDLASEVLVASEIVAALLGNPSNDLPPTIARWLKKKSFDRGLVTVVNDIIMNTEFEDNTKEEWKSCDKKEKWNMVLSLLSNFASSSFEHILERSELKDLWVESNDYDKWRETVKELRNRCTK